MAFQPKMHRSEGSSALRMQQPLLKHAVNANALLYFQRTFPSHHHLWTTLRQLFIVAKQSVIDARDLPDRGAFFSLLEFDLAGKPLQLQC